jgi:ATP-dependent helicase/nuclease subunit A
MNAPRIIPDPVRKLQAAVSDPKTSAWVAANAGSGKTHVLAQRVINLLLDDVDPAKILCITFTKAAAANMAKRVFDRLAEWTTLDDAALDRAILETSGVTVNAARRALARRLFARALETPGGLKVQTIHAFCTQLLHQFPFEANVAARFMVLDETAEAQLLESLSLDVLLAAAAMPDSTLGRALATAITLGADQTFRDVVNEAIGRRDAILQAVEHTGSVETAVAELCGTLGVAPGDSMERVEAEIFSGSLISESEWPVIAAVLADGLKSDIEQASRLTRLATLTGSERLDCYLDVFCTEKLKPRTIIVTKTIRNKNSVLFEQLVAEQERVCKLLDRRRAIVCRDRSAALLTVAHAVLERYRAEKERRGLLDYDDLIDKTLALLDRVDAAWVHYKLDRGIDHVLIDEAQDTSKKQWAIVCKLVAEFFAGEGARAVKRTIFVVGDEKQSIFSFQEAAPREFAQMRDYFRHLHSASALPFIAEEFKQSFRSGELVLGAVDEVFRKEEIRLSVTTESAFPAHVALPDAAPSLVEIWEPMRPDEAPPIEGWDAPFDTTSETSPRVRLAQRIARTVREMIERRVPVGRANERRPVRPGDILVLVRQRGPLFEAIIRALKNEAVAVAGADRLVLTDHIAVMDLMALADALLLPQDDLALAAVLRSPLFGFSEDDLFKVAHGRGRSSLRAALARRATEGPPFAETAARLDDLAEAARRRTPFDFYAALLGAGGARQRFLARLGLEASDALDEFMNLALDYERRETPSLQGFVAWLRAARAEIRRDMEIARDEVRVMTVHGAKGLEAPVVILADTMTPPTGPRPPRLLMVAGRGSLEHLVWAGQKDDDVDLVAAARADALAEAEHEYRRLLYVAMTRAAERLIVCGAEGKIKRPKGCWYDLIRDALAPGLVEEGEGDSKVWHYRKPASDGEGIAPAAAATAGSERRTVPAWLRQQAPAVPPRASPLSPSAAYDEAVAARIDRRVSTSDHRKALARGRLLHRLMQSLPDIPAAHRAEAARNYLTRNAKEFSADEQDQIAAKVLAILEDARFAALFAAGSRAEVPIVGRVDRGGVPLPVAGQVDRLAVTEDAVLIADFKTNRDAPRRPEDVPKAYIAQLALYGALLSRLYRGKPVRAALVWTDIPNLMEISAASLDAALARLGRGEAPVTAG